MRRRSPISPGQRPVYDPTGDLDQIGEWFAARANPLAVYLRRLEHKGFTRHEAFELVKIEAEVWAWAIHCGEDSE